MAKIDLTKYTNMVNNAAARVKISSTIFKEFIADIKSVTDGNDDLRIAHEANITHLDNAPFVKVYRTTFQSIPDNLITLVSWQSSQKDNYAMFDVVSPTDIVIKKAGTYIVFGMVSIRPSATGFRTAYIYKNGSIETGAGVMTVNAVAASNVPTVFPFFIALSLALNDIIALGVFQNSGGSLDLDGAGSSRTNLSLLRVGG